jgi:hypothetical protein
MQVIVVILFSFLCLNIQAQNCPKYDKAMTRGKYFLQRANYDSALVQFQVAQIAARECKMTTNEPADSLKNVFKGIQDQRDAAIAANKKAEEGKKSCDTFSK